MSCPQNIAGSGKATAVLAATNSAWLWSWLTTHEGDVLQLTLPATSVFGKEEGDKRPLQAYARYLAAAEPSC
jgi:hypothetical protein